MKPLYIYNRTTHDAYIRIHFGKDDNGKLFLHVQGPPDSVLLDDPNDSGDPGGDCFAAYIGIQTSGSVPPAPNPKPSSIIPNASGFNSNVLPLLDISGLPLW